MLEDSRIRKIGNLITFTVYTEQNNKILESINPRTQVAFILHIIFKYAHQLWLILQAMPCACSGRSNSSIKCYFFHYNDHVLVFMLLWRTIHPFLIHTVQRTDRSNFVACVAFSDKSLRTS